MQRPFDKQSITALKPTFNSRQPHSKSEEITMEKTTQRNPVGLFGHATLLAMLLIGMLTMPLAIQAALVTATWNGGTGAWTTAGNWDIGIVPNNGTDTYIVNIDGGKTGTDSIVTFQMAAANTVSGLVIDANDTLRLRSTTNLNFIATTLTNNGTLEFTQNGNNARITNSTVTNNGLMRSNGGHFLIQSGTITNNGTIRAQSGQLTLNNGANVTNTNGLIETTNNQTLGINNVTVTGGTLNINGTSVLDIRGSAVLAGNIAFTAASGTRIYNTEASDRTFTWHASGTYDHNGWFRSDIGSNRFLNLALTGGTVTIGGDGIIDLGVGRVITGSGAGDRGLISYNTIRGMGNIGNNQLDSFVNRGTVLANDATTPLTIQLRNAGTMENEGAISVTGAAGLNVLNPLATSGTVAVNAGTTMTVGGSYTQTAGTTTVNGTLAATQIALQGGILEGNGQAIGPVIFAANATVSPGNSIGTLEFAGDLTMANGAIYDFEASNGGSYDTIVVGGNLALGDLVLNLLTDNPTRTEPQDFVLFTFGGTAPTIGAWTINLSNLWYGTPEVLVVGDTVVLRGMGFIPEPSSLALLAIGGVAMLRRRRR